MLDASTVLKRLCDLSILNFIIALLFLALVADNHNPALDLWGYDVLAVLNLVFCAMVWVIISDICGTEVKQTQFCYNLKDQIPLKLYASWLFRATLAAFLIEMWVVEEQEYNWTNAYLILIAAVIHLFTFILSIILAFYSNLTKKDEALYHKHNKNPAVERLTRPFSRKKSKPSSLNYLPTYQPRVGRFKR